MQSAYCALLQSYHDLNSVNIDELANEPTALEFMRYVARNRPFVVRKAARDWPAVSTWNARYLKQRMGNKEVNIAVTPYGNADAPVQQQEGDTTSFVFVQPSETRQRFSDFIDTLRLAKDFGPVEYAQSQNDNLRSEYLPLFPDVLPGISWAHEALQQDPEAINVWIGTDRSVTSLHKDNYENIYVQMIGEKHFVLLPPIEGPCVNEMFMSQAVYEQIGEQWNLNPLDGSQHIPVAIWDPDKPDLETNAFSHLSRPHRVSLAPGDMLYLPATWYHKVKQTCGPEGICVAVNYWYDMDFEGSFHPTTTFVKDIMADLEQERKRQPT